MTMIRVFLLLLLWSVGGVKSENAVYSGKDELNNVTSNTIINISTDVVLSSNVILEGVNNITIIGQGNPTVNCFGIGSVKFLSCNNVTIEGINWERCGSVNKPGVEFYNTSNIAIQSCSFHHSTGKAVTLSKVSGNVSINNCRFTHNNYHYGHGAAIYYTSSHEQSTQLVINNCNFSLNGPAESVVYINNSNNRIDGNVSLLQRSTFIQNQGVPIYISHTSLILNNMVSFKDNNAIAGGAIYSSNSAIKFVDKCYVRFYNNSAYNGGAIYQTHSMMSFRDNAEVMFTSNTVDNSDGGAVYSKTRSLISFEDQSEVTFDENRAGYGGALYVEDYSSIMFHGNSTLSFTNNTGYDYGGAICARSNSNVSFDENTMINFISNNVRAAGGAGFVENSTIIFQGCSSVIFSRNYANFGGGAITISVNAVISFGDTSTVTFTENSARFWGGAVYVGKSDITFHRHSTVTFSRNHVDDNAGGDGGAIYICSNCEWNTYLQYSMDGSSTITFTGHSTVMFSSNNAISGGGAISLELVNTLIKMNFTGNSNVTFSNNTAERGGALFLQNSKHTVIFQRNTNVKFANNRAVEGGAIHGERVNYFPTTSNITFTGSATVDFCNNIASLTGGAISFHNNYNIWFTGGSTVHFNNNLARRHGGAIYLENSSKITFTMISVVEFNNNTASLSGGAISLPNNSSIWFTGRSTTYFNINLARQHGGAISSVINTRITFTETCSVMFTSNTAMQQGGAVYLFDKSIITFGDSCNVSYNNNTAVQQGGAVYFALQSIATFKGNSVINFERNKALLSGGALYSFINRPINFEENSKISFYHNMVRQDGGAIQSFNTTLHFSGSSSVNFTKNTALQQGGALDLFYNSAAMFQDESNVTFTHNAAMQHGGAVYVHDNSSVSFVGNTKVAFDHNMAESGGGAIYSYDHCNITIGQCSEVMFVSNSAMQCGGAMHCDRHSDVTLEGPVTFTSNTAEHGGAVCVSQSIMKFANNSKVMLNNNRVVRNGGGLHFSDHFTASFDGGSYIRFSDNIANQYGGALYCEVRSAMQITLNPAGINFTDNVALIGDSIYLDIQASCNETCFNNSIVGIDKETIEHGSLAGRIHTPPSKLVIRDPALCIDDDNVTNCGRYYVNNIMLGQEIMIDACVLDYYDQPAEGAQFAVTNSSNYTYYLEGSNFISVSCDGLEGISILGKQILNMTNLSLTLTSHAGSQSGLKKISMELITELSPCHPGFYHDVEKCVCYRDNDIITCSGSTSFIRRGYWFGVVDDKSTVTVCPNNYCNFTCCEVTNGFYQLSPVRMNQCTSQRSGTACGSCEEGYTLSFDSIECVNKCTTGQTVLVVTLSMIYWIVIVILVFIMIYYHVGIGYLYAITYYYSMLDILLSQSLYQSKRLFTAVSIMSSVAKITPQFLGQFCLVEHMSGIDQQFIHYTHPLAVSVIIVIICQAARISLRFSSFISRGIIRTICFLLLLSYPSVATTSLLLLRSLTFDNVDKVYTYLSPDIEYCHGRHLPYFIVAVLCTLVIVIGLPLLLLLEPFLNHKINFTRMKPLLDQFQGCYKEKYHCFSAYYMICRIAIILIIISIPSGSDFSQFVLIFSSVIFTVIALIIKPYKHQILNLFDGLILLLVVLATLIPLADNVSQQLSTATIICVMILPLIFFIALELIVHKETIKTITTKMTANFKKKPVPASNDNNEIPMGDIGLVIDNNMRKNATICTISSNISDDATHYRESFIEVMDQIED